MRNTIKYLSLVVVSALLSSCVVGPLVGHETARTVGKNGDELIAGYGTPGLVFKYTRGITENFDLGLQLESMSVGLRAKYAFVNARERGFSFAGALGLGENGGGKHYYGDLDVSYLQDWFEPYVTVRYVHVRTNPHDFKSDSEGSWSVHIDSFEYPYGQAMLGSRFWLSKNWLLSAEVSSPFAINRGLRTSSAVLAAAALGFRY